MRSRWFDRWISHPVVTWGNGTGTMPSTYSFLLNQPASHGFIVIASNRVEDHAEEDVSASVWSFV